MLRQPLIPSAVANMLSPLPGFEEMHTTFFMFDVERILNSVFLEKYKSIKQQHN